MNRSQLNSAARPQQRATSHDILDTEPDLIIAAQRGDRAAFDTLLRTYDRQLRGLITSRVGPNAADDVLQETWLAGWLALPSYTHRARFKVWIFCIAYHKCADYHRSRMRFAREAPLEQADWQGVYQADEYAAVDERQVVQELLAQLPDILREVIELYYYPQLTLTEVAQVLNRNLNTVKNQFYRAHALMAKEYDLATTLAVVHPVNGQAEDRNIRQPVEAGE